MSDHNVEVKTLMADGYNNRMDRAFMHVDCGYGYVEVHTGLMYPTFIVCHKSIVHFIQFSSEAWARDWFTFHQKYIDWIGRLIHVDSGVAFENVFLDEVIMDEDDFLFPGILGKDDGMSTLSDRLLELADGLTKTGRKIDAGVADVIFDIVRSM